MTGSKTIDFVPALSSLEWVGEADPCYGLILHELRRIEPKALVVGGACRDFALGEKGMSDLDLIVPNRSIACYEYFAQYPVRVNRHGNFRFYLPGGQTIDVIEPRRFYRSFLNARDALSFFDLSVNAVAVEIGSGDVLDPLGGINDCFNRTVTLPPARWTSMSDFETVHLLMRLLRYVRRHDLAINNIDLAVRAAEKVFAIEWSEIARLNGGIRRPVAAILLSAMHPAMAEVLGPRIKAEDFQSRDNQARRVLDAGRR